VGIIRIRNGITFIEPKKGAVIDVDKGEKAKKAKSKTPFVFDRNGFNRRCVLHIGSLIAIVEG
jgi:hypothetical protein